MADQTFTDKDFQKDVLENDKLVVVDFWAPWCGPCKMVSPIIEELAEEYKDKVVVGKMNVDENQIPAEKYGVMSIPTVMFFKGGKPVQSLVGAQGKQTYKAEIEKALAN